MDFDHPGNKKPGYIRNPASYYYQMSLLTITLCINKTADGNFILRLLLFCLC
jgi:hypothetical protein